MVLVLLSWASQGWQANNSTLAVLIRTVVKTSDLCASLPSP